MKTKIEKEIRIYEAASSEPITLCETKIFLRMNIDEEDELIMSLIKAATIQCEFYTGKSLITKKYKLSLYGGAEHYTKLPYGPIENINSIKIMDEKGNEALIDSNEYYLDTENNKVIFSKNLYSYKIEIIYTSGYGNTPSDIPEDIKQGLLMHIARIYGDRNEYKIIPRVSLDIYNKYKEIKI